MCYHLPTINYQLSSVNYHLPIGNDGGSPHSSPDFHGFTVGSRVAPRPMRPATTGTSRTSAPSFCILQRSWITFPMEQRWGLVGPKSLQNRSDLLCNESNTLAIPTFSESCPHSSPPVPFHHYRHQPAPRSSALKSHVSNNQRHGAREFPSAR